MIAVYKYEFAVANEVDVEMPSGAEVVAVGSQDTNHICLWAIVDTDKPVTTRKFQVCGTGHPLDSVGPYIGTVFDGPYVWHVFGANRLCR